MGDSRVLQIDLSDAKADPTCFVELAGQFRQTATTLRDGFNPPRQLLSFRVSGFEFCIRV